MGCRHELGQVIEDKGAGAATAYCRLCGIRLYVRYGPLEAEDMGRLDLEEAVYQGLRFGPKDGPLARSVVRDAIKLKPTAQLEDIHRRMKEAGR